MPRKLKPHNLSQHLSWIMVWNWSKPQIINFFTKIFSFFIPIFVGLLVKIATDPKKPFLDLLAEINNTQWIIIGVASIILPILKYFEKKSEIDQTNSLILNHNIIFEIMGAAIDQFVKNRFFNGNGNNKKELLIHIQKIVILVLKDNNISSGIISANIMIRKDNNLELVEFDIQTARRRNIVLPIDLTNPGPGAPKACVTNRIAYVHNTNARDIREYFDVTKVYKSFFSIPLSDQNQYVWGVINIDSSEVDQFCNISFINDSILSAISPIISLIQLEHKLADIKANQPNE